MGCADIVIEHPVSADFSVILCVCVCVCVCVIKDYVLMLLTELHYPKQSIERSRRHTALLKDATGWWLTITLLSGLTINYRRGSYVV